MSAILDVECREIPVLPGTNRVFLMKNPAQQGRNRVQLDFLSIKIPFHIAS
jgi:hypothetical protein